MDQTERLETARLWMRPFRRDDVSELHRLFTDPRVRRYLLDDQVVSIEFVETEIAKSTALFAARGFGMWSVFLLGQTVLIGFCGFRHFHEPPELQLLYGIAPAHWNKGLATEAARAMIRHGFEVNRFDRIIASADAPNTASQRVLEKAGMHVEKRVIIKGLDTVYYAIARRTDSAMATTHACSGCAGSDAALALAVESRAENEKEQ
jgi:ribosomal-protein-alanine N-acetyltransferase